VVRFYRILAALESRLGGARTLAEADGRMGWPQRGVYFFFEPGEYRTTSGAGPRVTRVGTHALKVGSRTTLWQRLSQHQGNLRGTTPGGGNHRGSVFRLHVGTALIRRDNWPEAVSATWAVGSSAPRSTRDREQPLEKAVSRHIRSMPFLWLGVEDDPGPSSLRGYLERNAIALLSNYGAQGDPIDAPSPAWLGQWAASPAIRSSGLWNVNHVDEPYDPAFLDVLANRLPG
jgi:hypothetical protein